MDLRSIRFRLLTYDSRSRVESSRVESVSPCAHMRDDTTSINLKLSREATAELCAVFSCQVRFCKKHPVRCCLKCLKHAS
eukprot:scaffold61930_cov29-Attheya_sp.AAC.1